MAKRAISVTLETNNLAWLKGQAGASGESVSKILDQIVTAARQTGHGATLRSVSGTIDIDPSDPLLEQADAAVRSVFDASLSRPMFVQERAARYRAGRRGSRKQRG